MLIKGLDHLVMTVRDIDKTIDFYSKNLEMSSITFRGDRKALLFGNQKINLHEKGKEFKPHAKIPTPGSLDLCFITDQPVTILKSKLEANGITIIEGPVERTGAQNKILSIYFRDLDHNLIEISNELPKEKGPEA